MCNRRAGVAALSQLAAAQTLDGIRKTIRILLLPLGGDVSDWLDEGMTTLQRARFELKSIQWLWPNRYDLGKLGLLVGWTLPLRGFPLAAGPIRTLNAMKEPSVCDLAVRVTWHFLPA